MKFPCRWSATAWLVYKSFNVHRSFRLRAILVIFRHKDSRSSGCGPRRKSKTVQTPSNRVVHHIGSQSQLIMIFRTRILCSANLLSLLQLLIASTVIADLKQRTHEFNKWHLTSASSESEAISNNYVSASKDRHQVEDVHKNHQLSLLQEKIQQQIPKESKFFDEFEGSELKFFDCLNCRKSLPD